MRKEIEQSDLTITGVSEEFGVPKSTLYAWVDKGVTPRGDNLEKKEKIMDYTKKNKRIEKHPSFGYATPEEIEKLKTAGKHERDKIMSNIKARTAKGGKRK